MLHRTIHVAVQQTGRKRANFLVKAEGPQSVAPPRGTIPKFKRGRHHRRAVLAELGQAKTELRTAAGVANPDGKPAPQPLTLRIPV